MGRLVVFDGEGTLFDDATATRRLRARLGPDAEALARAWRQERTHEAWARGLMGAHRSMSIIAASALDRAIASVPALAARVSSDPSLRDDLVLAARRPDAFAEARDVLSSLRTRGDQLAILADASVDDLVDAVAASGLGGLLDAVLSVDDVDTYLPHPRGYRIAFERFDRPRDEVTFVSARRAAVAGAVAFGLVAVWIDRAGEPDAFADLPASSVGRDLRVLL